MTEEQWLACTTNPTWMVNAIRNQVSSRKLRLFAVACIRSLLPCVRDVYQDNVVRVADLAEQVAEGSAAASELEEVRLTTSPWDNEMVAALEACNQDATFSINMQYSFWEFRCCKNK